MTDYLHHDNEIYSFIDSYIILQISFVKKVIIKKKHLILSWFNRNPCQYESTNYSLSSNTCHDPVRWGITWRWFNIRLRKFLDDMIADISKSYYTMDIYIYIYVPWIHYIHIWRRIFSNDMSNRGSWCSNDFFKMISSFIFWLMYDHTSVIITYHGQSAFFVWQRYIHDICLAERVVN